MFKKFTLSLLTAGLVASSYIGIVAAQSSSSQPAPGLMPRGTAALPGMYFAGDRDTGMYWIGADTFGLTAGGVARARVDNTGLLVGAQGGSIADTNLPLQLNAPTGVSSFIGVNRNGSYGLVLGYDGSDYARIRNLAATAITLETADTERLRVQADGTISVGTSADSGFKLDVNGSLAHNGTQAYWRKGTTTYTTGSGTYTVPAGVRAINVRMVGGGGGGGYARAQTLANSLAGAAPGQSGYCVEFWLTGLAASYSYAVGAGGAGGVAATTTNATSGGNTTFSNGGTVFSALGGIFGASRTASAGATEIVAFSSGGAKEANAGATVNARGVAGRMAFVDGTGTFYQAIGGESCLSGETSFSSAGLGVAVAGVAGDSYGGGGGGAAANRSAVNIEANGGAGAAGIIIIEEYF